MKAEKGLMRLLITVEVLVLIFVAVFGAVKYVKGPEQTTDYVANTQNNVIENTETEQTEVVEETEVETETEEPEPVIVFSEEVQAMLDAMSVEEKVAQMLMVSPEALTETGRVTMAGNMTRTALQNYPVGGVLLASRNYQGRDQMRNLIRGLQSISFESSGRYLHIAYMGQSAGNTVMGAVRNGGEADMITFIRAGGNADEAATTELFFIPYFEDLESMATVTEPEAVRCVAIGPNQLDAVVALQNGADMICITENMAAVYQSILDAVNAGQITVERMNEAVGRILTQKAVVTQ